MTDKKLPWYLTGENKRNFIRYFHESPSVDPVAKAEYAIFMSSAFRKEGKTSPEEAAEMAVEFKEKFHDKVDLTIRPYPQKPSEIIQETATYFDAKQIFLDFKSSQITKTENMLNQKSEEFAKVENLLKEIETETHTYEREIFEEGLRQKERLKRAKVEFEKAKECFEKAEKILKGN